MPHLTVEYAKPLEERVDVDLLVQNIFQCLANCGVFQPETIIVRAKPYEHYQVGTTDNAFMHLTLYLYAGRTDEQLKSVTDALHQVLLEIQGPFPRITLRIEEMAKSHYTEF